MIYDPKIQRQTARYKKFFEDDEPGKLMIQAMYPHKVELPKRSWEVDLADVDFENEKSRNEYLDIMVAETKTMLDRLEFIDDDLVPSTHLKFGQAHVHCWLTDAPTSFYKDTSWTDPVLKNLDRIDDIRLDKSKRWYKIILESYRYLVEASEGKYLLMTGGYGPLDLAQALRDPTELFVDFYDSPDLVKKLLFRCADVLADFQEAIWDYAGLREQGEILWSMYVPSPAYLLSVDGACMMSRELFEEFERPAIIRQFRGRPGLIHTHMLGQHLQPSLVTLDNVRVIDVGTDPNTPRCMDIVDELAEMSARTGKAFYLNAVNGGVLIDDIYDNIEVLKKGRFIINCGCEDLKQARELVEFVRANSIPLE